MPRVISPVTRAVDERQKRAAYRARPTPRGRMPAEPERAAVRVFRRQGQIGEVETLGAAEVLRLASVDLGVAMQGLHAGAWR